MCSRGVEPISSQCREALCSLLQTSPCTLHELSLSFTKGLEGLPLGRGLLIPPGDAPFACYRLRILRLARVGLTGIIPEELCKCAWLEALELQDNQLEGAIPDGLWSVWGAHKQLHTLALHGNGLSGELPHSLMTRVTSLSAITLGGEAGGNAE